MGESARGAVWECRLNREPHVVYCADRANVLSISDGGLQPVLTRGDHCSCPYRSLDICWLQCMILASVPPIATWARRDKWLGFVFYLIIVRDPKNGCGYLLWTEDKYELPMK